MRIAQTRTRHEKPESQKGLNRQVLSSSFKSLEEVVDFYDLGGGPNPAHDPKLKPLGLSSDEKEALVAFLATL